MKLSTYIEKLQELLAENGDLQCIYSKDDEGNGYGTVNYSPSLMRYDYDEREAYNLEEEKEDFEEDNNEYYDDDFDRSDLPLVVCVN
jgi:hypothetical protein